MDRAEQILGFLRDELKQANRELRAAENAHKRNPEGGLANRVFNFAAIRDAIKDVLERAEGLLKEE